MHSLTIVKRKEPLQAALHLLEDSGETLKVLPQYKLHTEMGGLPLSLLSLNKILDYLYRCMSYLFNSLMCPK